jgi:uncharacterized protein (TIGR03437 family)
VNSAANPAKAGSIVSIWAIGTGSIYPRPLDGQIATAAQDYECCQVEMSSSGPVVLYAGAAPGMVAGVVQINFQILPYVVSTGVVEFEVIAAGSSSSPAGVYVTP